MSDVGRVAVSLSGHDAGRLYLVVGEENDLLLLANGKQRRLDSPKRKKRKHIRRLSEDLRTDPGQMTDRRLRKRLNAVSEASDVPNRIIN